MVVLVEPGPPLLYPFCVLRSRSPSIYDVTPMTSCPQAHRYYQSGAALGIFVAGIAQLGEQQTEVLGILEVPCSIHGPGIFCSPNTCLLFWLICKNIPPNEHLVTLYQQESMISRSIYNITTYDPPSFHNLNSEPSQNLERSSDGQYSRFRYECNKSWP